MVLFAINKRVDFMKKTETLKKNYEFKNILNRGSYISARHLECFFLKNKKNKNLIGIAISSKIAKAYQRNRIKRLVRQVYSEEEILLKKEFSMVFLCKKKSNIDEITYKTVKEDVQKIFKGMKIYLDD